VRYFDWSIGRGSPRSGTGLTIEQGHLQDGGGATRLVEPDLELARRCGLVALDAGARPAIQAPLLPSSRARQKLERGVPLLDGEAFDPDYPFCRQRLTWLIERFETEPQRGAGARALRQALEAGRLDFERAVGEALANHPDHLARLAAWAGLSDRLLIETFELTVRPSLRAVAELLGSLLGASGDWQAGYCPLCGAWPGLAVLSPGQSGVGLQCVRCATEWHLQSLRCWFCGCDPGPTTDQCHPPGGEFSYLRCQQCQRRLRLVGGPESGPRHDPAATRDSWWCLDPISAELAGPAAPSGYRLELAEPEPDEALDDLLESD
jgi:FdhE protein